MNMAAVADRNSRRGCSAELMIVTVIGIRTEFYIVNVASSIGNCLAGYRCKTVIVRIAWLRDHCAANDFMNVLLDWVWAPLRCGSGVIFFIHNIINLLSVNECGIRRNSINSLSNR